MSLTLEQLIAANRSRVAKWHSLDDWSPLEWAGAMCGEAGEAANFAKKLKRLTTGIPHHDSRLTADDQMVNDQMAAHYKQKVTKEVCDAIIYGILLVLAVDGDLEQSLKDVFNDKSIEYGFPERL